jgi:hypothetical protein
MLFVLWTTIKNIGLVMPTVSDGKIQYLVKLIPSPFFLRRFLPLPI